MRSLQIATNGVIPLCVKGLSTLGMLACETTDTRSGGGVKRRVVMVDEALSRDEIAKTLFGSDGEIEVIYKPKDRIKFAPPIAAKSERALDVEDSQYYDAEYAEIVKLLQRQAIIDHQRRVLQQIQEEIQEAEELALLLLMLDDD